MSLGRPDAWLKGSGWSNTAPSWSILQVQAADPSGVGSCLPTPHPAPSEVHRLPPGQLIS